MCANGQIYPIFMKYDINAVRTGCRHMSTVFQKKTQLFAVSTTSVWSQD